MALEGGKFKNFSALRADVKRRSAPGILPPPRENPGYAPDLSQAKGRFQLNIGQTKQNPQRRSGQKAAKAEEGCNNLELPLSGISLPRTNYSRL